MLRPFAVRPERLTGRLYTLYEASAPHSVAPALRRCPQSHHQRRSLSGSIHALAPSSSSARTISIDKYQHFDPKPALDSAGRVPIAPYDAAPLACSAPSYPKGHLIIHPYSQPRPQETWPAAVESVCPLLVEIGNRTKQQLSGWGVAFSDGDPKLTAQKEARFPEWDVTTSKVARPVAGDPSEEEEFLIRIYQGNGTHATIGPYSVRTLPADLTPAIEKAIQTAPIPSARYPKTTEESHIYVCTHGSRDCRCGVVGTELRDKLREEVRTHEVRTLGEGSKKVRVFGISHVGGHKWAANALLYPAGDWYGNLRVSDSPLILRSALAPSTSRHDLTDQRERLVHWPRWRGRLGLTEEQMRKVWDEWGGGTVETAVIQPIVRRRAASPRSSQPVSAPAGPAASSSATVSASHSIPFRKHTGEVVFVDAKIGENLKDVAQRGGLEEIEATCGGKCECATCHAYLANPATPSQSDAGTASPTDANTYAVESNLNDPLPKDVLPAATDEESDMLDYAISRKTTSRLLCQVTLTQDLVDWFARGGRVQLSRY